MTTRPVVSIAQLDALEAAAEGTLTRPDEKFPHWRIGDGLAVTPTARALLDRGLIEEQPPQDGQILAIPTEAGRAILAELASRAPAGKDQDADPS